MTMNRNTDHPIDPVFLNRWSPRSYEPNDMPKADLLTIIEAARWAPSAFNIQPWRFAFSQRNDAHWDTYVSLLDDFNTTWAPQASALIFLMSDTLITNEDGSERTSRYNSFDAGAAWAQLALQASSLGYNAHAMAGLKFKEIPEKLNLPDRYKVEIAITIGKRGAPSLLPNDLQPLEQPSQRFNLDDIAVNGIFQND